MINKSQSTIIDINAILCKRIRKKLKIVIQSEYYTEAQLLRILKRDRQKKITPAFKEPNLFELMDDYTSQHDEDGHEEEFINEIFDQYPKNAIFI